MPVPTSSLIQNGSSSNQTSHWPMTLYHLNTAKNRATTENMLAKGIRDTKTVCSIVEANRFTLSKYAAARNVIINDQTALVVSNDLTIFGYERTQPNFITALIGRSNKAILILCVYLNPKLVSDLMPVLIQQLEKIKKFPFLCMGDFNCEHPFWSIKDKRNLSSDSLANFIKQHSLTIYNPEPNPDSFTFKRGNNFSWIDLIFGNVRTDNFLLSPDVIIDHKILSVDFALAQGFEDKLRQRQLRTVHRNLKYPQLKTNIDLSSCSQIDSTFKHIMIDHLSDSKIFRFRTNNSKTLRLRKRIKSMKRNNSSNHSNEINEMIKELKLQEREERQKIRKNSIIFVMRNLKNTKAIWQILNRIIKPVDTLSALLADDNLKMNELRGFIYLKPHFGLTSGAERNCLDEAELVALRALNFTKQSGYADDFSLRAWNIFWEKNKEKLIKIIAETFTLGYIPQTIKIFGAHLIPKPDGRFRMIRISNFMLQIYDKILSKRIQKVLPQVIIKNTQFAYQNNLNTLDLHVTLTNHWHPSKSLICADLEKAFDTVKIDFALDELSKVLCSSDIKMIRQFVHGRWLRTRINDTYKYRPDVFGVPQGSKVGPLLFICALNKVIRSLKMKSINIMAFADDVYVVAESKKCKKPTKH
ncbi:uncharacterized protein LOC107362452 [Tetranychus urticae]|uniref:uncharacterized protein LOC107362452 n=1 Tax=Tetranychus urticae TaxID=32264 RepID=UPI00077BC9F6|nr:uncharacterized protein LOC107362452 [Tetranychus urticae]